MRDDAFTTNLRMRGAGATVPSAKVLAVSSKSSVPIPTKRCVYSLYSLFGETGLMSTLFIERLLALANNAFRPPGTIYLALLYTQQEMEQTRPR